MHPSFLDVLIWGLGFLGETLLLVTLVFYRYTRSFPIFVTLIAFNILRSIFLCTLYNCCSHHVYFIAYWSTAIPDYLLQFGLLYEIIRHVFCINESRFPQQIARRLGALVLVSIIATAFIISNLKFTNQRWILNFVDSVDMALSVLQILIFTGVLILSGILKAPWKSPVQKIAMGTLIYSLIGMVTSYEIAIFHLTWVDYYQRIAYLVSLVYWTASFIVWPQVFVVLVALLLATIHYWQKLESKRSRSWESLTASIRTVTVAEWNHKNRNNLAENSLIRIKDLSRIYHNAGVYAKLADYASQHTSSISPEIIEELYTEVTQVRLLILSAILSRLARRIVSCKLNTARALKIYEELIEHITAVFEENCPTLVPRWTEIL